MRVAQPGAATGAAAATADATRVGPGPRTQQPVTEITEHEERREKSQSAEPMEWGAGGGVSNRIFVLVDMLYVV